ncbi:hypothetical protein [Methylobacterium brachiatum]|uniref:hypothetical protein n=1 Tax=Methylobacterium brachiatum TaxID=269660 RepID=UPI0008EA97F8|nr:hypothetical protein [Methylobacterium brachiatum]SFI44684.1 hypothetical protein SAMN02799642_01912 [Methylobacterium brachiatum]
MPRWLFLILVTALALSVVGGVLIVLRSPRSSTPQPEPAAVTAPAAPAPRPGGNP